MRHRDFNVDLPIGIATAENQQVRGKGTIAGFEHNSVIVIDEVVCLWYAFLKVTRRSEYVLVFTTDFWMTKQNLVWLRAINAFTVSVIKDPFGQSVKVRLGSTCFTWMMGEVRPP